MTMVINGAEFVFDRMLLDHRSNVGGAMVWPGCISCKTR